MFSVIVVPLLLAAAAPARADMVEEIESPMRGFESSKPKEEEMGEMGETPAPGAYGGGNVSAGGNTMCEGTQTYNVKYDMVWSGQTHPIEYPSGMAMFTPFNTIAHNADISLWSFGSTASEAVRLVAEMGDNSGVEAIAEECIGSTCGSFVQPGCLPMGSGVCVAEVMLEVDPEYPYVSSVSMHFPSPDWMTGVDSALLCKDGRWVDMIDFPLWPLDAGTDSGLTFLSPDLDTQPRAPITNFADIMPSDLGHFYNPQEGRTLPVGTLYFTRQ